MDIADAEDASISKNIIHEYPVPIADDSEMTLLWKRMDFGHRSPRIDYDKLKEFLRDNRNDLISVLRYERYEMLMLATEYLVNRAKMSERDIGRLEMLVGDYRRFSLRHHVSRGLGLSEVVTGYAEGIDERTGSLL